MAAISTFQFKRGTKSALTKALVGTNKLLRGEPAWEIDTNKLKIGDGSSDYSALPYLSAGGASGQLVFGNHYEFPTVGQLDVLYIAKDEAKAYIWNATGTRYETLTTEINAIDAGGANAVYY